MDSLQFYPDLLKDDELEELWMRAQTIEQCAYTQAAANGNDSFNREEYYSLIRTQSLLVSPEVETKFIKMEPLSVQIGTEQQVQDNLEVTKSDQKDEAKSPNSGKIFQRIRSQVQKFWFSSAKDTDSEGQESNLNQNLIDSDIISNYSNNSLP
uniref:Uncharacterized protein n=1 Tax=Ditylenchus dipsaci TaxID=166011 RepID=A0A915D4F5_9BILA